MNADFLYGVRARPMGGCFPSRLCAVWWHKMLKPLEGESMILSALLRSPLPRTAVRGLLLALAFVPLVAQEPSAPSSAFSRSADRSVKFSCGKSIYVENEH